MNQAVIDNSSLIILADRPTGVIVASDSTIINKDDAEDAVILNESSKALVLETNMQFAVVDYTYVYIPELSGSGTGGIDDAPQDGKIYVRKNAQWIELNSTNYPIPPDQYLYDQVDLLNNFRFIATGLGPDPKDGYVSFNALIDMGVIKENPENPGTFDPTGPVFMPVPPTPAYLVAVPSIGHINLNWIDPRSFYINHDYTEIFRSTTNSLGTANLIGTSLSTIYSDTSAEWDVTYYYWIRNVSLTGMRGNFYNGPTVSTKLTGDVDHLLIALEEEIRHSQLHQSLLEPIEMIDGPGGLIEQSAANALAIQNEVTNRVEAIQAEAIAREQALLQEALDRGTAIDSAVTILESADINLAQQIDLVTSTSNATFDTAKLWQFDTTAESWTGNGGTITVQQGWIIPPYNANTYVTSPALNIDGATYTEVRIRIRKVGLPIWSASVQYTNAANPAFSSSRQVVIPEPTFIGQQATVSFNMTTALDWTVTFITGLRIQLSLNSEASNHFEIDWIGVGRRGPGASIAAILEERIAWTNGDAAEAALRTTLATQMRGGYTGTDINAVTSGLIYSEKQARVSDVTALAVSISALTAGTNTQFDYAKIWYFDESTEGWTGGTIAVSGWLRCNAGSFPTTNLGSSIGGPPNPNGYSYTQVRFRYRKIGSPVWVGEIKYTLLATGSTNYSLFISSEPTFDIDGVALVTVNATSPWITAQELNSLLLNLYTTSSGNTYEVDWIAIGRPTPGASSAALVAEQQARASGDAANASSIAALAATVGGKANQSALDSLSATVSIVQGDVNIQGTKITSLESQYNAEVINTNPSFANWTGTYPNGYAAWTAVGISKHTGAYAYSSANALRFVISAANSGLTSSITSINNPDYIDIEIIFTLLSGGISGAGLWISWVNTAAQNFTAPAALKDYFLVPADIYGKKSTAKIRVKRPSGFTGTFLRLDYWIMGNYSDPLMGTMMAKEIIYTKVAIIIPDASAKNLDIQETRITAAENNISVHTGQISSLNASVAGKADATALTALTATVTSQGGQISANATQITQLQISIPGSGNLIPTDTEFTNDMAGWIAGYNSTGSIPTIQRNLNGITFPTGINVIGARLVGLPAVNGEFSVGLPAIPVVAGKKYSFSIYGTCFRSLITCVIFWHNSAGGWFDTSTGSGLLNINAQGNLENWARLSVTAVAPAGAITATALVFCATNSTYGSDPFIYFCRPMFSEIPASTTQIPAYSAGGTKGSYAAIQQEITVRSSETAPLIAQWSVKSTVGSLQGGVGFYNDGVKTRFAIHADQFWVYSPGANAFSLIVEGTQVVMDGAYIKNLSVGTLKLTDLSVTNAKLGNLSVTNAKFSGYLRSDNYVASFSGWNIDKTGTAEFQSIYARGNIEATSLKTGVAFVGTIQSTNYSTGTAGWKIFENGNAEFNGLVISRANVVASGTLNITATSQGASHFSQVLVAGIPQGFSASRTNTYLQQTNASYFWFSVDIPTSSFNPDEVGDISGRMLTAQAVADNSIYWYVGSPPSGAAYTTPCNAEVTRALRYGDAGSFIRLIIKVYAPTDIHTNVREISITRIRWTLSAFT